VYSLFVPQHLDFIHAFVYPSQAKQTRDHRYVQAWVNNLVQVLRLPLSKGPTRIDSPLSLFHLKTGADLGYERLWIYKTLSLPSSFNSELISGAEIVLRN
jgi:hypothetical protein